MSHLRSNDDDIHCFKVGQPCAAGKDLLKEEIEKLLEGRCRDTLIQDPFESDDDASEVDTNEICIENDNDEEKDASDSNDEDEDEDEESDVDDCNKEDYEEHEHNARAVNLTVTALSRVDGHNSQMEEVSQVDKESEDRTEDCQMENIFQAKKDGERMLPVKRKQVNQNAKDYFMKKKKIQVISDVNKGSPIDVEKVQCQKPEERWIPELVLFKVDTESLQPG